ncbi:hypothetical protein [Pseudonocardia sp. HH130630-07]|uniref:hypothetical protein n=1 Tax=Pseudonocardia sp. HH130630-07 TaxID=1690815 RepID=UPI0008153373|nr:hypothetical protein [Pseudonocardia sp. HH130630-07]ANY08292.1 hypothetical protein AFB00_20705 [Pseudonocardia sp. HH130630-07]
MEHSLTGPEAEVLSCLWMCPETEQELAGMFDADTEAELVSRAGSVETGLRAALERLSGLGLVHRPPGHPDWALTELGVRHVPPS